MTHRKFFIKTESKTLNMR